MTSPLSAYPRVRPRRMRARPALRDMMSETTFGPSDLILPLFVHDGGPRDEPIASMPGVVRHHRASLVETAAAAWDLGIPAIALFPKVADDKKSVAAKEAHNDEGLIPEVVRALKRQVPGLVVITDVALDPYSSLGQDGIVRDGEIVNDETIDALILQAACHARAGADMVAPSDMMDGRIGRIRDALDEREHQRTAILAYSAKYASVFYGPFRDALDSAPRGGADKKTYQMDPANSDEALHEAQLDLAEGADMVMVKPGLPYLDILYRIKTTFGRPTAVYQVSGEYAMLKAAAAQGWIDERSSVLETLLSFKRAGADSILSYYALTAARWLREG
jgi:porphobilinogen synthase